MARLVIEGATKTFGEKAAVADVSLVVEDGDFAVLLGPSGCGKTTLLRLIAGFERLDSGRILLGGEGVSDLRPGDRDVAMVFQGYALYPHMTVYENIAFGLRAAKVPRKEVDRRVRDVAETVEIGELLKRKPGTLSGGQRQRVALARAISREPRLFLMDEPLSNLDTQLRASMRAEIKRLQQVLGATIVYVTHDQVEAMTMGTTVALLRDGQVEQVGSPQAIYASPANEFVAGFLGSPPMRMVTGTLRLDSSRPRFEGQGAAVELPGRWRALPGAPSRPVRLGLRPEDVCVNPPFAHGVAPMATGRVEMSEPLGHETLLHLRLTGGAVILARVAGTWRGSSEETVEVGVDPERLQLFDADSGLVMAPPAVAPVAVGSPA